MSTQIYYSPPSLNITYSLQTPTCCNEDQTHLSQIKVTITYEKSSRGTEVRTTQPCCSQQNHSGRELTQYDARTFITSPNAKPRPIA
jgi:hypothetical protein